MAANIIQNLKMYKNAMSKVFLYLRLIAYFLIPIVLIILPADFFDDGSSKCLSVLLFDLECLGCGMTRASMHFIHLEFTEAISYNLLVLIVFPLLALIWASWFWSDYKKFKALRA